jgi:hypothetical protein
MNALGRKVQASGAVKYQNTLQGLSDCSRAMGLHFKYLIRMSPNIFLMTSNPTVPLIDLLGDIL